MDLLLYSRGYKKNDWNIYLLLGVDVIFLSQNQRQHFVLKTINCQNKKICVEYKLS